MSASACDRPNADRPDQTPKIESSWRHVHVGDTVYTGDVRDGTQPICESVNVFLQSWRDGNFTSCHNVRFGIAAKVEEIVPSKCGDRLRCFGAVAQVREASGKWSGYSGLGYFQPNLKPGTVLLMVADWGSPNRLLPNPTWTGHATDLGPEAVVKIIRYAPQQQNQLFVVVLSTKYKGRTGWMSIEGVNPAPDAKGRYQQGLYGLIDPSTNEQSKP